MFIIDKAVGFLFLPSNFIAALALFGLVLLPLGWRYLGHALLLLSAVLLLVVGWSPIGALALSALESRYAKPELKEPVAGIIMLGGAIDTHISVSRGQPTVNDAGERLIATAELSRSFPNARLILSGGMNHVLSAQAVSESTVARDILIALGVAPDRIEMDEKSRDTCENAVESARMAKAALGETWVVVTSASHMPRAMGCFEAASFSVVPYPVDYRTRGDERILSLTGNVADGLADTDLAAHEWIGLAGYWITGRTARLLPE